MFLGVTPLFLATLASGKNPNSQTTEAKAGERSVIQDRPNIPTVLDIPRVLPAEKSKTKETIKKYLYESEQDLAQQPFLLSGHPFPIELPALELLLKNQEVSNRESSP